MNFDIGLGRLVSHDPRDSNYRLRSIMPQEPVLPAHRHYQVHPRAPLDQGATSSCVGHACHGFLMAAPLVTGNGPDPLYIYRQAQKIDEWAGEEPSYYGTTVRAGLKVMQDMQYISEYRWTWTADEVMRWMLAGHGTVILGTNWYSGMMVTDKHGYIAPTGRVSGGHAYLAIGASQKRGIRILNSWGRKWGDQGRAWMTWEHLERLLGEAGEAAAPIETRVILQAAEVAVQ